MDTAIEKIHVMANRLLTNHLDQLTESELKFLKEMNARKIRFGTPLQRQRVDEIEARFNV